MKPVDRKQKQKLDEHLRFIKEKLVIFKDGKLFVKKNCFIFDGPGSSNELYGKVEFVIKPVEVKEISKELFSSDFQYYKLPLQYSSIKILPEGWYLCDHYFSHDKNTFDFEIIYNPKKKFGFINARKHNSNNLSEKSNNFDYFKIFDDSKIKNIEKIEGDEFALLKKFVKTQESTLILDIEGEIGASSNIFRIGVDNRFNKEKSVKNSKAKVDSYFEVTLQTELKIKGKKDSNYTDSFIGKFQSGAERIDFLILLQTKKRCGFISRLLPSKL